MNLQSIINDPLNIQIITLLEIVPLSEQEKSGWHELLPYMEDHDKEKLIKNLEAEIDDFDKLQAMTPIQDIR